MKKKILPVLVALFLIIIIGGFAVGSFLMEKYSYSREKADLNEYFQVSGEQLAIILQDEMLEEKAILREGVCYFDLATVHQYFNEIFYVDRAENLLLYTTAEEIIRAGLGESSYS
ncbi:MAG: chitinase, partial [Acetatifactor sp.]